jgi:bifunctional NMN adenylyltransferase/nudix hydrolase
MARALDKYDRLIVVLGSAECYPNVKNPFPAEVRERMIRDSLSGKPVTHSTTNRLSFVHVPDDYYDDPRWFRTVRARIEAIAEGSEVCLTGFDKDESSYYLHGFGNWPFEPSGVVSALNATDVRNAYFVGDARWKAMVPDGVREVLEDFASTTEFERLAAEWRQLQWYKAEDKKYPYPINHVTLDAVVIAGRQVLLVERGGVLGRGAWALPGGFLEHKETLLGGAKRELLEETGLQVEDAQLKAVQVFDYPGRSQRGRVITHAHMFHLEVTQAVAGHDDAKTAFWFPLEALKANRAKLFDDHYQIIAWFLERSPV